MKDEATRKAKRREKQHLADKILIKQLFLSILFACALRHRQQQQLNYVRLLQHSTAEHKKKISNIWKWMIHFESQKANKQKLSIRLNTKVVRVLSFYIIIYT